MFNRHRAPREFVDTLAATWPFEECTKKELQAVASLLTPISVQSGRKLTRQGQPGLECFIVVRGQAIVERNEQIVGHAVDGSVVGEVALMRPGGRRNATVTAATDMELLVMSRSDFASLRNLGIASVDQRLRAAAAAHDAFEDAHNESIAASDASSELEPVLTA